MALSVGEHLQMAIAKLQARAELGASNYFCAKALVEAALTLDAPDIAVAARRLPIDAHPLAGALTNIESEAPPQGVTWGRMHVAETVPIWNDDEGIEWIQRTYAGDPHIQAALLQDVGPAMSASSGSLGACEVASTLAVVGNLGAAIEVIKEDKMTNEHRQCALIAVSVQASRAKDKESCAWASNQLPPPESMDPWTHIHLALGLSGRRAWEGYPFPDY